MAALAKDPQRRPTAHELLGVLTDPAAREDRPAQAVLAYTWPSTQPRVGQPVLGAPVLGAAIASEPRTSESYTGEPRTGEPRARRVGPARRPPNGSLLFEPGPKTRRPPGGGRLDGVGSAAG